MFAQFLLSPRIYWWIVPSRSFNMVASEWPESVAQPARFTLWETRHFTLHRRLTSQSVCIVV